MVINVETFRIIILSIITISAFVIFLFALIGKKTFKTLLLNIFAGLCMLLIFKLLSPFLGFNIAVNKYTVIGCGVFGVPALIGFLLLNILFI